MEVRMEAQGKSVPAWTKMAEALQQQLQRQREQWRRRLAKDPASFGTVEVEVHQALQQTADQIVAGLLAEVGAAAALENACKKSR